MRRTAVITGATGSIGAACARKLAKDGWCVVLSGNSHMEKAEELKAVIVSDGGEAQCFRADVSKSADADALIEFAVRQYGAVDALVCCAGISRFSLVTETSDEEWREVIDTDLSSVFYTVRAAAKRMIGRKSGSIIAMSSIWGSEGASMESAYAAAKGGIEAFIKSCAKEFAPSGITANCIAPGVIDTPMNAHLSEDEKKALCEEIPLGRFGTAEEVADITAAVINNRYITGQIIGINGGIAM